MIENAGSNYSAYVPDLPGCVAVDETLAEVERLIREAIEFHLEGMRDNGSPIPPPSSKVDYIEVAALLCDAAIGTGRHSACNDGTFGEEE